MCTHTHTYIQNTQLYLLGEGLRELHEVALTLIIIVHSERMSLSEPRKPLNFPQRKKGGESKMSERRMKWTDGERKRSDKSVPNEKRRQDEKDYSCPGSTLLTFKGPFCGSCTSVLFQPDSSSLTNNTH